MTKLREQLWAVAKEYARQFGEIIGQEPDFWIGDDPFICSMGDYVFTLDDMKVVIDRIDEYVKRYGSKDAVGQEVIDWIEWWLEDCQRAVTGERVLARITHQLRPNISLASWLDGCPRDDRKAFEGPDADYYRLLNDIDTLERLEQEYRCARSMGNVLENLRERLKIEKKRKEERNRLLAEEFGLNDLI